MRTIILLFMFAACNPKPASPDSAGAFDSSNEGEGGPDGGGDPTDDLPGISAASQDPGGCEEVAGSELPGAATMFHGEYWQVEGETWAGQEQWLIFSNAAWRAAGGDDCVVVWSASASETAPPACSGCDIGLSTTLSLDEGATTCDSELVSGLGDTERYGISRSSSGDSSWYFAESGDEFGAGYHTSTAMNFLTDPSCRWW
jgi:hypothetical protein